MTTNLLQMSGLSCLPKVVDFLRLDDFRTQPSTPPNRCFSDSSWDCGH